MDRIILSGKDVETLLNWRDNNADLVRRNAAPFKGIILEFPETKINIKAYNDAGKISFYIWINASSAGKITGRQLPGGFFKAKKNTTRLEAEDVQSIITVYASLMAFIVYHKPEAAAAAASALRDPRQEQPKTARKARQKQKSGITYLFNHSSNGPQLQRRGQHASPAAAFTVRGHYRHYKSGKTVWIQPYIKGNGDKKSKKYKLN